MPSYVRLLIRRFLILHNSPSDNITKVIAFAQQKTFRSWRTFFSLFLGKVYEIRLKHLGKMFWLKDAGREDYFNSVISATLDQ